MSESVQVRQQLSSALDTLRQLISNGELILFLGEQASCLPQPASVKDWWKHLGDLDKEDPVSKIDQLESNMRENQQWLHTILRTLGRFPIIFNVNPDRLVEHYLIRPGDNVQTVRLDRVGSLSGTWPNDHRVLLIKCFGDASYDEKDKLTSASKNYMETFHSMASEETTFVENLFHQHSILFLGCEKDHPLHKAFMERFVKHSKGQHYLFQRGTTSSYFQDGHLTTIQTDMEINEFAQYLTPGSTEFKIRAPGEVYEHSYLPTQREQYLKAQLTLEAAASEIGFHTAKVTNALATDEALEAESRGNLEKMFKNDPFIGQYDARTVQGAMDAMKGRRDNLLKLIQNGVRVTAIFRFDTFEKDIVDTSTKKDVRQRNVRKYASVLLQSRSVLNNQSMLELRVVQDMNEEQTKRMKEQYAVIRLKGSSDEAIAYASPAVEGKKNVSINLISVNGTEAARKRKIFEESREAAWDHEKSMLNLTTALLQADEELKAISTEDRNKLQRLYNVQMLTKTEIEPGTWEKLGEGSFGAVFKVQWKGKEMAYKVLQKISKADDLEEFEGEYQSLKKIHHPNIISVAEMYRTDNPIQLGILMEYMSGGSVRDVMNRNPGQGQSKDFVSRLAMQVACALDYLHSLKPAIIHRDIKADNIFMTADKQTFKLGDFGLSRITYSTYQTKTMGWGCYRYMAPEMGRTQKYSPKVDVYAFGLLLVEVITGNIAFSEIMDNSEVFKRIAAGQLPVEVPEECEKVHGLQMKATISACVIANSNLRPKMEDVIKMLQGKLTKFQKHEEVELLCLGTGKGATAVQDGEPSSSFVILHNGKPVLLVDIGYLVMMQYQQLVGKEPVFNMFITHNHSDHAGELPVSMCIFVPTLMKRGYTKSPFKIFAGSETMPKLINHRMDEAYSMPGLNDHKKIADWRICSPGERETIGDNGLFSLETVKSQHSEVGYGFVLYYKGSPILGYSGDSGFVKELYDKIYEAPTVIVDGRERGTWEHAGFDEIKEYTKTSKHEFVYVTGYGAPRESPGDKYLPSIKPLEIGQQYPLVSAGQMADGQGPDPAGQGTGDIHPGSGQEQYPTPHKAVQSLGQ